MGNLQLKLLLLLSLSLGIALAGGEHDERILLGNVFSSEALKNSLSSQMPPAAADPFRNEPKIKESSLASRKFSRQPRNRKPLARAGHAASNSHPEPVLELVGKGGHSSSSSSKSKGKGGKGMSKSKSKSKSKSSSRSRMSKGQPPRPPTTTTFPTFGPSLVPAPSPSVSAAPSLLSGTATPTCSPTSGFFPPDVSGFFGAPSGESSALQTELDAALTQIQVPSEFGQQCVQ